MLNTFIIIHIIHFYEIFNLQIIGNIIIHFKINIFPAVYYSLKYNYYMVFTLIQLCIFYIYNISLYIIYFLIYWGYIF